MKLAPVSARNITSVVHDVHFQRLAMRGNVRRELKTLALTILRDISGPRQRRKQHTHVLPYFYHTLSQCFPPIKIMLVMLSLFRECMRRSQVSGEQEIEPRTVTSLR